MRLHCLTGVARWAVLAGVAPHWLMAGGAIAPAIHFEPSQERFVARTGRGSIAVSAAGVQFTSRESSVRLRWIGGSRHAQAAAGQPTGGVGNYVTGSSPAAWRTVPHYGQVRVTGQYRGIDTVYYGRGQSVEFDLSVAPGGDPARIRFDLQGQRSFSLTDAGDLSVETTAGELRLRRPHAWQPRGDSREEVACDYLVGRRGQVGFRLGSYDGSRPLVIDPVIDALTWLGGSGQDEVQTVAADANGNPVVAGLTNSTDFPGAPASSSNAWSVFVTKLNPDCSAIAFTTVLASGLVSQIPIGGVQSMAVDAQGAVYVAVYAFGLPTTSGAWQTGNSASYIFKLDSSGKLIYSTALGPAYWGLSAQRLLVRNGIAYVAGTVSQPEFLGTPGALQRNLGGGSDFFVLALTEDGSAPVFATAFGGSGSESLNDMALDQSGNIVLVGTSSSTDFPVTADALPYAPPAKGGAVLTRIDSTGSRLLYSTWLGTSYVNGVTLCPDGNFAIGGNSQLPAGLTAAAPHASIRFPWDNGQAGYLAKFSADSNQPLWTTDLTAWNSTFGAGMTADAQGNLYLNGYVSGVSGGSVTTPAVAGTQYGVTKFSADGQRLLYSSGFPATSLTTFAAGQGSLWIGGWSSLSTLPVTPGAVQPQRNPAPPGTYYAPLNYDDGFVGNLDLSSFVDGNFFVGPGTLSLSWRIGEPLPAAVSRAVEFSGGALTLQAVSGSPALTASFVPGAAPAIQIGVNSANATVGNFSDTVTVSAPSIPNSSLALPVYWQVQPSVSFDVAPSQVTLEVRQGQQFTQPTVQITAQFGKEYFYFSVASSDSSWLNGWVETVDSTHLLLHVGIGNGQPGTYDGTLTLSLQGLPNPQRVVNVHYVIDPPAVIQVSPTLVTMHVIRNQPVAMAVLQVTSASPNVGFGIFVGMCPTWLKATQVGTTTPGQIQITADSTVAETGYYSVLMSVTGESGPGTLVTIQVDVSTGAPLDVTPSQISYTFYRNGPYALQYQTLAITAATATPISLSLDQTWVMAIASGVTPTTVTLVFNPANLPEGIHNANLTISGNNATVVVPIEWKLYDTPTLVFSGPSSFAFQYQIGDAPPPTQQLQITSPTITAAGFAANASNYPSFLTVSPPYGGTPATLNVGVNPTGLAPGTYKVNLMVSSNEYLMVQSTTTFPVTLTVTANPNAPAATIAAVADAANYLPGVSPGEIVSIWGSGLGPATLVTGAPDSTGKFPFSLAGTTVYFDGIAAPIVYASDKVTAVVAPFEIAGQAQTEVTVETGGKPSAPFTMAVNGANPGIFTTDASGSGAAAVLTYPQRIFVLYATGLGVTTPVLVDGSLNELPLAKLNANVRVLVGGQDGVVQYAGPAPGLIAGAVQINIQVPDSVPSGPATVLVVADGNPSQPGVTIPIP